MITLTTTTGMTGHRTRVEVGGHDVNACTKNSHAKKAEAGAHSRPRSWEYSRVKCAASAGVRIGRAAAALFACIIDTSREQYVIPQTRHSECTPKQRPP